MQHTLVRACLKPGFWVLLLLISWNLLAGAPVQSVSALAPTPPASTGPVIVSLTDATINKAALEPAVQQIDLRVGNARYPGCLSPYEEPSVHFATDNLSLTDISIISTCGWKADELVKVTLMDPTGKFTTTEVQAVPAKNKKDVYQVDVFYQPGIDARVGRYRFTLHGSQSGTIKAKVDFVIPQGPRLYVMAEDPFHPHHAAMGGNQRLRLHNFLPNEPVKLLAYTTSGSTIQFYGWQDFTTDSSGRLIVETNLAEIGEDVEMNYFAYARETHFVQLERFTPEGYSKTRQFDMDLYCPGAETPKLSGAAEIQAANPAAALKLYQVPGFGSRVTAEVPGSTPVKVFGYPKCIDHAFWWKVAIKEPIRFGWMPESFLGKYVVELVEQ